MTTAYIGNVPLTVTDVVGLDNHVHPILWPVARDPDTGTQVLLEHRFESRDPRRPCRGVDAAVDGITITVAPFEMVGAWWFGFAGDDTVYCGPRELPPGPLQGIIRDIKRADAEQRRQE